MAGGRLLVMAVLAAVALAGCGAIGGAVGGSSRTGSCGDIAGGACGEQMDAIAARHPGAKAIDITCTAPVCDRRGGSGTAVVTLANGTTVKETFTYTGNPAPVPQPACSGMALDLCRTIADRAVDDQPTKAVIVGVQVTCTSASCTEAKGSADVNIVLGDGTRSAGSRSWEGGP